jgi:hypothetical protein
MILNYCNTDCSEKIQTHVCPVRRARATPFRQEERFAQCMDSCPFKSKPFFTRYVNTTREGRMFAQVLWSGAFAMSQIPKQPPGEEQSTNKTHHCSTE